MVAQFINSLLAVEQYSFSLDELMRQTQKSKNAVRLEISNLIEKNEVLNLRHGFYLILPPKYRSLGKLPLNLYVNKLFSTLERKYYIGFYSAAKIYGASHQQSQVDYILSQPPKLLDVKKSPIALRFLTTKDWPKGNVITKKSDAGLYNISSPILTLADLVRYQNKLGGINRMLATIEELMEEVTKEDVVTFLKWYDHKATLQRLGFLMRFIDEENEFSTLILNKLQAAKIYPILLQPVTKKRPGAVDNPFKVAINITLDNDI